MRKIEQLERFRAMGLPTPAFRRLTYADFRAGWQGADGLRFPVAVRSSFRGEDGTRQSFAGRFLTRLWVGPDQLGGAIAEVFASYPEPDGQEVIVQEMVEPSFGGVLFAYPRAAWRLEWIEGHPEALVGGRKDPHTLWLPRFAAGDARLASLLPFWRGGEGVSPALRRELVRLAVYAGRLLRRSKAEQGLDIEFVVAEGRLFLLQARPITTPWAAEELLTAANHKEILPPRPTPLMTDLIVRSGQALYGYYRSLDPSLPERAFIEEAAGMPWINLSALLDTMVHWGLPTRLVSRSVGAEDPYRVGFRPWRSLRKGSVFLRLLGKQLGSKRSATKWMQREKAVLAAAIEGRRRQWADRPHEAAQAWIADFSRIYLGLVGRMQDLTGAMAGPVQVLERLGLLDQASRTALRRSASTQLFDAFRELQAGRVDRADFLRTYGHRGFYESDIGQPRFREWSEADWARWLEDGRKEGQARPRPDREGPGLLAWLVQPVNALVQHREWLRHEAMRLFDDLRKEMQGVWAARGEPAWPWWAYRVDDLLACFDRPGDPEPPPDLPKPSGWDRQTFLADRRGRRRPWQADPEAADRQPLGLSPGRIRGRVWRVDQAGKEPPSPPERPRILVAPALDPGWAPYFARVDGVISYTGGLLSHASILLREAGIPAVTRAPGNLDLRTGEWVEIDGATGAIRRLQDGEADRKGREGHPRGRPS